MGKRIWKMEIKKTDLGRVIDLIIYKKESSEKY